jgi:adenosine deaminase CECR1
MAAPLLATKGIAQSSPGSPGTPGSGAMRLTEPKLVQAMAAAANPADMSALFEVIKRESTAEQLYRFLYALPKGGDIHHHLGGGFLPYMWYAVGTDPKRNGGQRFYTRYRVSNLARHPLLNSPGVSYIFQWRTLNEKNFDSLPIEFKSDFKALEDLDEAERKAWMSSVVLDEKGEGRDEFFEYHWTRLGDLMASIHVMTELFVENMKMFGAEGTSYLEIQRGAFHYKDGKGELLPVKDAEAFWTNRLAQKDAIETGVKVRWQGVVLRFAPNAEETVRSWYEFIDANREVWVGLNMAGREDDNRGYPARFKGVYDEMLRKYPGIGLSIHAGEAEKPDSYIRDTLRLGATRIGHGINLLSDEDTLLRMRDSKFMVEINLISNELLGYVPQIEKHPFPIYLRQGVPCCLNTDDRGMWDSNFTDEYFVGVKNFNLSWSELLMLGRNSYQHSFADAGLKHSLSARYEESVAAFAAQFNDKNWKSIVDKVPAITHGYGENVLALKL